MAIWNWFQRSADKIQAWDWSPEMKSTVSKINDMLPETIAKALLDFIKQKYEYSEDVGKKSLQYLKESLFKALS